MYIEMVSSMKVLLYVILIARTFTLCFKEKLRFQGQKFIVNTLGSCYISEIKIGQVSTDLALVLGLPLPVCHMAPRTDANKTIKKTCIQYNHLKKPVVSSILNYHKEHWFILSLHAVTKRFTNVMKSICLHILRQKKKRKQKSKEEPCLHIILLQYLDVIHRR